MRSEGGIGAIYESPQRFRPIDRYLNPPFEKGGLGGFLAGMLRYRQTLKSKAQDLRGELTEAEQVLWGRLCRKQMLGVQFYRQKPIGNYIVDFYTAKAKLVVEVDGSQHLTDLGMGRDRKRDEFLKRQGLLVLRFNDSEVLRETDGVVEAIYQTLLERLNPEIPPLPPFSKGGH